MEKSKVKKNKDVKFSFKGSFEDYPTFKRSQEIIEKQGSIQVTDENITDENNIIRIYNPSLFIILTEKDIPVINSETNEETTINGTDYLKTYIQGFNEGMQYFSSEYANPEKYVSDIHYNYFHASHSGTFIGLIGWKEIKKYHPRTVIHKFIKEFGYYSGIVSKVEELKEKYPVSFQNFDNHNREVLKEKERKLSIPTKASQEEILNFWLKLQGNNEKGLPYWESEKEIEHFVHQNFDIFPGVDEIKVFNPNMSKSELNHVTWTFYRNYGMSKTKRQYEKLLMLNFTKFKDDSNVYSNIKDMSNEHLKKLFK